jgi:hypothetical protein
MFNFNNVCVPRESTESTARKECRIFIFALLHRKGATGRYKKIVTCHADDSTEMMDTEFADGGEIMR